MATQNSTNLTVTNNADGFDIAGGTTVRKITVTGGDISMTGTGAAVITFPTTSGTLATLAGTEALTNKTTINTLTIGLGGGAISSNTAVGLSALAGANTGAGNNVAVGLAALLTNTSGTDNMAIGGNCLRINTTGTNNTAIGFDALRLNVSGSGNTAIGIEAGANTVGGPNVFIGAFAGRYETGSNALYIDSRDRSNTAGDKANAIIYGIMDAAAANQTFTINATVFISVIKSGATQAAAGAGVNEIWKTNGHATLPNNVLLIGV